ncbi:MAG: flagellar basal body P-ring formation chaperone FlgA [Silvania sp.]|uniref:flagellar basal body P-ring formation chaperone FlgA n=1 Tax=Silvania sp. TaxID=3016633 RepID=UPI003EE7149A
MILFSPLSAAAPNAAQQIDAAVTRAARSEINDIAASQGWEKRKISTESVLPPEANTLVPCTAPLLTSPGGGNKRMLMRLRYEVSCPGPQGWSLTVAVKASVRVPLVTSAQMLERGRVIGPADVVMSEQNVALIQDQGFSAPQQVVGQTVKRRINAGQTLTASLLDRPVLIERGQSVTLIINNQGIQASTAGEALKQGRQGEMIRVRNSSSQRIVEGLVESSGVVRILGAP